MAVYRVGQAMRSVTLRVDITGIRTWRLRLWLGTQLLRLAAIVMGCGIRFDGMKELTVNEARMREGLAPVSDLECDCSSVLPKNAGLR